MARALICPHCHHPLTPMDSRGVDFFCQECFASLAIVAADLCYYQLGKGSGRLYRCTVSSIEQPA